MNVRVKFEVLEQIAAGFHEVGAYGSQTTNLSERLQSMGDYFQRHVKLDKFDPGTFLALASVHNDIESATPKLISAVYAGLEQVGEEMMKVVRLYKASDDAATTALENLWSELGPMNPPARRLDWVAKDRPPPAPGWENYGGPWWAGLNPDPDSRLTEPRERDTAELPDHTIKKKVDTYAEYAWTGPSDVIFGTIEIATGVDVVDECAKWYTGDWQEWYRSADALMALGHAMNDVSRNVYWFTKVLQDNWEGRAAEGAFRQLHTFAQGIDDVSKEFKSISKVYVNIASSINASAEICGEIIKFLIDEAIIALLAASGAPSLAVVLQQLNMGKFAKMAELAKELINKVGEAKTLIQQSLRVVEVPYLVGSPSSGHGKLQSPFDMPLEELPAKHRAHTVE
jgi:hypothetical protein